MNMQLVGGVCLDAFEASLSSNALHIIGLETLIYLWLHIICFI